MRANSINASDCTSIKMDMHSTQKSAHQYSDFEMGQGNGFPEDDTFYNKKKTNADDRRDMMRMNKPQEMRV